MAIASSLRSVLATDNIQAVWSGIKQRHAQLETRLTLATLVAARPWIRVFELPEALRETQLRPDQYPDAREEPKASNVAVPVRRVCRCILWSTNGIIGLTLTGLILFCLLLLVTPAADQATSIVRTRAEQHDVPYPGTQPPRRFTRALIATEDQRFYSAFDVGIDPFAAAKIIFASIIGDRGDQGGSTIDQQLAKMLYTPEQSGHFLVDFLQVALAVKLHLSYSNAAILQMYSEVAYFGSGYYGLDAASQGYFGKPPADLTWGQSAMLAGIVNAPSRDNPRTQPANAFARQAHVFNRLVAVGELTRAEADHEMLQPLGLVSR